ncbi:MAG: glycosyltransferase [bacterium]
MNNETLLIITDVFPNPSSLSEGTFIFNRVAHLQKHIKKVHVLYLNSVMNRYFKWNYIRDFNTIDLPGIETDITVSTINYPNIPYFRRFILTMCLQWFVNTKKCSLIHFHFLWNVFATKYLNKHNIPYVVTCHGSDINALPLTSQSHARRSIQQLNQAPFTMFVSKGLYTHARKLGYIKESFEIIPNGIDSSIFCLSKHIKKKPYHIGFVGWLDQIKRAHLLPDIFMYIKKQLPNLSMVVVGKGYLKKELENKIKEYKIGTDFVLKGVLSPIELAKEMQAMQVLLLPSIREGWGCVILEAQACGAAVVGTNVGGIPEAIGPGGTVVDDDDQFIQSFSEAVIALLKHPISEDVLTKRAMRFNWERLLLKEYAVYQRILNAYKK